MNQDEQEKTVYVLVSGLEMEDSEYDLGESVFMRRLERPITSFDLAGAGGAGFRGWALLQPMASISTIELISSEIAAEIPGYDALNKCWLVSALMVIRGFGRHLCSAFSYYSWNVIAGFQLSKAKTDSFRKQIREEGADSAVYNPRVKLPPFKGGLLDFHVALQLTPDSKKKTIDKNEVEWIQNNIRSFNLIAAKSESFRFALEAAVDWRYSKDKRIAISRLWAGIESILGIQNELTFRIALYSSLVMAERGPERVELFNDIKELYALRSKAVHGSKMKDEEIKKGLGGSFVLLRTLLLDAVSNGSVRSNNEWLALLLS